MPYSKRAVVQSLISDLLQQGIIEIFNSPFQTPWLHNKKGQPVRLCFKAKWVNKIIVPDRETPEQIETIFKDLRELSILVC